MHIRSACVLLMLTVIIDVFAEDFYQLLGVSRQANSRDIRKSFKKLALSTHPDKNRDDPEAHNKFLKINRAYEVLKDDDLRKKYDMYGEDGLKEDSPTGRGYQSWNFYNQDFGIYDEDPEVITLSKSDFELSVEGTEDIWFVNFYSPQCSHCHELAPTWREVARELFGVIRIGAVNCADDWHLCQQKGIQSYPTLILYPEREKFYGSRTKADLIKYSLEHVRAQVVELWSGNFKSTVGDDEKSKRPWLITFCGDGGDCLERSTVTKLSAMLDELVSVAMLYCTSNEKLCEELGVEHGTYFYKDSDNVEKGKGLEVSSLDAKEVAFTILEQMPDVTKLDIKAFTRALADVEAGRSMAWLIHFVEGEVHDLELRKLPALVHELNVGRVDCRLMRTECNNRHIHKFPTFAVFKVGGHEIHYGRQTAHDIAAFAKDSSLTPVRVIGPADLPTLVAGSQPWFIDFFAPWCPPCMRLLPEFRKASKQMGTTIRFGTVDCSIHSALCQTYNVNSYPTTILFNQTVPHQYHGQHSDHDIVEFLHDLMKPPVRILDDELFESLVMGKAKDQVWLVDFYAPWCGPCQQLAPEWRRLAKVVKDVANVNVGQVDCQAYRPLCQTHNVQSYPTIRLYPPGPSNKATFHIYNGWFRDAQSIRAWAFEYMPTKVAHIEHGEFYTKVLLSSEPWIVDFYAPWCGHCQVFAPEFERVAQSLDGRVNAGKVNCEQHQRLCQEARISAYPSVRYYRGVTTAGSQNAFGEDVNSQDANYIIEFLNTRVPKSQQIKRDEL